MARILIIEDSPEIHWCYETLLAGHDLVTSLDEAEITALVPTVDLVICDYHFSPRLTFERVREIVGESKPLILCTGESHVSHSHKVDKINMSKTLKPIVTTLLTS